MADFANILTQNNSAPNEFPTFHDGDVLICLTESRQYKLHSRTLRMHSDYFRRQLTDSTAAQLTNKAKRESAPRWRLDLCLNDTDSSTGEFIVQVSDDFSHVLNASYVLTTDTSCLTLMATFRKALKPSSSSKRVVRLHELITTMTTCSAHTISKKSQSVNLTSGRSCMMLWVWQMWQNCLEACKLCHSVSIMV